MLRRHLLAAIVAATTALGCNGPLLLLPGGRLAGEPKPVPSDWSFAGSYGTCLLYTSPSPRDED